MIESRERNVLKERIRNVFQSYSADPTDNHQLASKREIHVSLPATQRLAESRGGNCLLL